MERTNRTLDGLGVVELEDEARGVVGGFAANDCELALIIVVCARLSVNTLGGNDN